MALYDLLLYTLGRSGLLTFILGFIVYVKITRKFDKRIYVWTPSPPLLDQLMRGHLYTAWIVLNKKTYHNVVGQETGRFDFRGNSTTLDLILSILNVANILVLLGSLLTLVAIDYL